MFFILAVVRLKSASFQNCFRPDTRQRFKFCPKRDFFQGPQEVGDDSCDDDDVEDDDDVKDDDDDVDDIRLPLGTSFRRR